MIPFLEMATEHLVVQKNELKLMRKTMGVIRDILSQTERNNAINQTTSRTYSRVGKMAQ